MHGRFTSLPQRLLHPDPDTRFVLQSYAALTIVAGLSITGTGIRGIPGMPQVHASLIWISGMAILAAGCAASGLSLNDDPVARRRSIVWFAAGHLLLGLMVFMQWPLYWKQQGLPFLAAIAPLVGGALLLLSALPSWLREASDPASPAVARVRSRYDEHIREVARREERARLARDLHDAVKQQLFVIQTAAATAQTRIDGDSAGAREALGHVRTAAREATTEMEALLEELQAAPLENTGLVEALKKQCEALALRTGTEVIFHPGTLPPAGSLPPGAHEAIYRVAQEALANVARHARATRVEVSLSASPTELGLRVADDGSGFEGSGHRRGMGITNMETRASEVGGRIWISRQSPGTDVLMRVPLVNTDLKGAWVGVAMFSLLALGHALFYGIRGESRDERTSLVVLGLIGLWAAWGLAVAYLRRRAQGRRA
jgi:signal transduction histidine kinase